MLNILSLCFMALAPRGLSRKLSTTETKYAPMLRSVEINPLYMPKSTNNTSIHIDTASMMFNAFPPFPGPAAAMEQGYLVTLT